MGLVGVGQLAGADHLVVGHGWMGQLRLMGQLVGRLVRHGRMGQLVGMGQLLVVGDRFMVGHWVVLLG